MTHESGNTESRLIESNNETHEFDSKKYVEKFHKIKFLSRRLVKSDEEILTELFKNKLKNVAITKINAKIGFVDKLNKIVFFYSRRAACSCVFREYLILTNLLEDANKYSIWLHDITNVILSQVTHIPIEILKNDKYKIIKFITNPYRRTVSSFILNISSTMPHRRDLTFRTYVSKLISDPSYWSDHDIEHHFPQYEEGEKNFITHYLKVNKNEKLNITLHNGQNYTIDLSKHGDALKNHHSKKYDIETFCGDIPLHQIVAQIPKDYKLFYDHDIQQMVQQIYSADLLEYNYDFTEI